MKCLYSIDLTSGLDSSSLFMYHFLLIDPVYPLVENLTTCLALFDVFNPTFAHTTQRGPD